MARKPKKDNIETVFFRLNVTLEQEAVLRQISDTIEVPLWNRALTDLTEALKRTGELRKPIKEEREKLAADAEKVGHGDLFNDANRDVTDEQWLERGKPKELVSDRRKLIKQELEVFSKNGVTFFDHNYQLPDWRREQPELGALPSTMAQECLKICHGAFRSFLVLRGNKDADAKTARERTTENRFYTIMGRPGCSVKKGKIRIGCGKLGSLLFDVPQYQLSKLLGCPYDKKTKKVVLLPKEQRKPAKIVSFTLSRRKEENPRRKEPDLQKPGHYRLSINYETAKPIPLPCALESAVYLAIGASRIGVVSPAGNYCLNLPRPDFHWMDKIEQVKKKIAKLTKGSRRWKDLMYGCYANQLGGLMEMYRILGYQQQQGQYEIVQKLLRYGKHFKVTKLDIRSKPGALADSLKPERGGVPAGANWAAQNTGNIGGLIQKLARKATNLGGSLRKVAPPELSEDEDRLPEDQRKILMAHKLRESVLAEQK